MRSRVVEIAARYGISLPAELLDDLAALAVPMPLPRPAAPNEVSFRPDRYTPSGLPVEVGTLVECVVEDSSLNRSVRLLRPKDTSSDGCRRFLSAMVATARLEHPAVLRVLDLGVMPDGVPAATLPVVEGRPFGEVLREGTLRGRVEVVHAVAEAVAYAHERGTAHGALGLDAVIVGAFGAVWVTGWGPGAGLDPSADLPGLGTLLADALGEAPEPDLRALAERATATVPMPASAFARGLADWLAGLVRRERALARVTHAEALRAEAASCRERAAGLDAMARVLLEGVRPYDPEERKLPGWRLEDRAAAERLRADLLDAERVEALREALVHEPDLPEAHRALAAHHRAAHADAERRRDEDAAAEHEVLLRAHDRGEHARYLRGDGAVTLLTDPPGAEVEAFRYEVLDGRLDLLPFGPLGPTPLVDHPLLAGSWLLLVRAPGHAAVRYAVRVPRDGSWSGAPPGATGPRPVPLPPPGELGEDDRYVPAGWFLAGGDPDTHFARPATDVWVDGLVVRRFPVTNREYLLFLEALEDEGRAAEAMAHAPRVPGADRPVYERSAGGRWSLVPDAEGDLWDPSWPVILVTPAGARAFCAWESRRTGRNWRLPFELEWEKAARGVDGRLFPWGDRFDASYAKVLDPEQRPLPAPVGAHPVDRSPYGVRDLAGGVFDLCAEAFDPREPPDPARVVPAADGETWSVRGGTWSHDARFARCANRARGMQAHAALGFRLVRSWPPSP